GALELDLGDAARRLADLVADREIVRRAGDVELDLLLLLLGPRRRIVEIGEADVDRVRVHRSCTVRRWSGVRSSSSPVGSQARLAWKALIASAVSSFGCSSMAPS